MVPEISQAPGTGRMGTSQACTNPPLGSGRNTVGPTLEYVRYSRSSSRFTVRERVYLHQTVMKAHRDFVRRIGLEFDPRFAVVQQPAQFCRYQPVIDSDISLGGPEPSSPTPHVAEHVPMQALDEFFAQQVAATGERPLLREKFIKGLH